MKRRTRFSSKSIGPPTPNLKTHYQYHACLGLSKSKESFEIQIFAEDKLTFAFRTNPQSASIVPPSGENIISFQVQGSSRASIRRGSRYRRRELQLQFQSRFRNQFRKARGRRNQLPEKPLCWDGQRPGSPDQLYVLGNKPIWLGSAKSIKGGTSYPIFSITPMTPRPPKRIWPLTFQAT